METEHRIESIVHSNIGLGEKNTGYQITGKSSGITQNHEMSFSKMVSLVSELPKGTDYSEAVIESGGTVFLLNISNYHDESGRPAPIASALAFDGSLWRKEMETPEKVFTCSREHFYEVTPSGARPGEPAELVAPEEIVSNGIMPKLNEIMDKYGVNEEKYADIISCVLACLSEKAGDRMLIALPTDQLIPQTARELMYLISSALPPALRAQLTFRLGNVRLNAIITFGPTAAIAASPNYVDLNPENNRGSKKRTEEFRGLDFAPDLVKRAIAGDKAFFEKMDAFFEEAQLYFGNSSSSSVFFNQEAIKWGKHYLIIGAYHYAAGDFERFYESDQTTAAFSMLSLCMMARPKTNNEERRPAWDETVGGILKAYNENPLHGSEAEGEIRLDENSVCNTLERGWSNIGYINGDNTKSDFSEQFIKFALSEDRRARFEERCRNNRHNDVWTGLYLDILNAMTDSEYRAKPVSWWYDVRNDYSENTPLFARVKAYVMDKLCSDGLQDIRHNVVLNAQLDRGLAEEFIRYPDMSFGVLSGKEAFNQFTTIISNFTDLSQNIFELKRFIKMDEQYRYLSFINRIKYPYSDNQIFELLSCSAFSTMSFQKKREFYSHLFGTDSISDDTIMNILHSNEFASLDESSKEGLITDLVLYNNKSDELVFRIFNDPVFPSLPVKAKAFIIREMIKTKKTGFVKNLLSSPAFLGSPVEDRMSYYVAAVEKYNSANPGFIHESVFGSDDFRGMPAEQKFIAYKTFVSDSHAFSDVRQLLDSEGFLSLGKAQITQLIALVYAKSVSTTEDALELFDSKAFTGMDPAVRKEFYAQYLPSCEKKEAAAVAVLCSYSFAEMDSEFIGKQIAFFLPEKVSSEDNREKLIRSAAFAKADPAVKFDIYSKLIQSCSVEFVPMLLGSTAFESSSPEQQAELYSVAIDRFSGKDDAFIIDEVFGAEQFGRLPVQVRSAAFRKFFLSEHDSNVSRSVLASDCFAASDETTITDIVKALAPSFSDGTALAVLKTNAVGKLSADNTYAVADSCIFSGKRSTDLKLEFFGSESFRKLDAGRQNELIIRAVDKMNVREAKVFFKNDLFKQLPKNVRYAAVDAKDTDLDTYLDCFGEEYLATKLTSGKKLPALVEKEFDPDSDSPLNKAFFEIVKNRLRSENGPAEMKRLYSANQKDCGKIIKRVVAENGGWGDYVHAADYYYSELVFRSTLPKNAESEQLQSMAAKYRAQGLSAYADKLDAEADKLAGSGGSSAGKGFRTFLVIAILVVLLAGALLFYVLPEYLNIDLFQLYPETNASQLVNEEKAEEPEEEEIAESEEEEEPAAEEIEEPAEEEDAENPEENPEGAEEGAEEEEQPEETGKPKDGEEEPGEITAVR